MTKRTNRLRRHYSRLTVFERVQLLLAAQERDDPLEIRTLDQTCPGADLYLYIARMLALEHSACLLVVQLLAQALLLVTRHQALPDNVIRTGPPDPDLVFLFERQAALWYGFAAWCRDLGHDPHQVLLMAPLVMDDRDPALYIVRQQIECFETWAESADAPLPDSVDVESWRCLFAASFRG